jgi:hypothetical protein
VDEEVKMEEMETGLESMADKMLVAEDYGRRSPNGGEG